MAKSLTFSMVVSDALAAMAFYETVFDAQRGDVYDFPKRKHENEANVIIAGMPLRLIDANESYSCTPPAVGEVDSVWLQIVVEDVEATLQKAVDSGAQITMDLSEFLGTRHAQILDPFGYTWTINQVLHEVPFEERYKTYLQMQNEGQ